MTDLRTPILQSVARAQSDFDPQPGAPLVVGTRQAFVASVTPEGVTLHYEDGMEETQPVEAIRGRAIATLDIARGKPPALIEQAWDIAKAKDVPPDVRAGQLGKMALRATMEEAVMMRAWSVALMTGKMPVRVSNG